MAKHHEGLIYAVTRNNLLHVIDAATGEVVYEENGGLGGTAYPSICLAGAMPVPSRRLLPGLWATVAPRSRMRCMSSSSSQTQWAPVNRGPSNPRSSRCAVNVFSYRRNPATA